MLPATASSWNAMKFLYLVCPEYLSTTAVSFFDGGGISNSRRGQIEIYQMSVGGKWESEF